MSYQSVLLTQFVVTAAEIGLAIVAARVVLATLLALAARLARGRPAAGRLRAAALRTSPRFARSGVAALVGTALVLGSANAATAKPNPPPPAVERAAHLPVLDRVLETVATGGTISWREEPPPSAARPDEGTSTPRHVVASGETLWSIAAASLGPQAADARIARAWPRWYRENRQVIGPDPSRIVPGTALRAPGAR